MAGSPGPSERRPVDELVPPPWGAARRTLAAVVVALLAAAAGVAWWTGALTPRLSAQITGGEWDPGRTVEGRPADLDVTIRVVVQNEGRLPATVTRWQPPRTPGVAWGDDVHGLPVRIEPGAGAELALTATVHDCGRVEARGGDHLSLRAHGPVPIPLPRRAELPTLQLDPPPATLLRDASPEDRSWVYHALSWPCGWE